MHACGLQAEVHMHAYAAKSCTMGPVHQPMQLHALQLGQLLIQIWGSWRLLTPFRKPKQYDHGYITAVAPDQ